MADKKLKINDWSSLIGGAGEVLGGVVGLFGNNDAAEEANRNAQRRLQKSKAAYMDYEFTNPYDEAVNVYENLRVDTRGQELANAAQAQQQANVMNQYMGGMTSGAGVASLASAMARTAGQQARIAQQQTSSQVAANQRTIMGAEANLQNQRIGRDLQIEQSQFDRLSTIYGMDMQSAAAAAENLATTEQSKADAFGNIIGGVASIGTSFINPVKK